MVITDYIADTCVVPKMAAKNKAEALRELTGCLFDKKRMKDQGSALDQIMSREATESTGIGNGIAVPHARIPGMKTLACAVGRVPNGIDFLAVDRKPVQLIFLICYPPSQQTTYLNFVATIARLLSDKEDFDRILSAESAEEMYAALQQVSARFDETQEKAYKQVGTAPAPADSKDGHATIILLARLQLNQEMHAAARSGKKEINQRMDGIRALVQPKILKHFDRLMSSRPPALVPVEGDTCQGCFIRLPSKFVQQVRLDTEHLHTCSNCSRYIYVV